VPLDKASRATRLVASSCQLVDGGSSKGFSTSSSWPGSLLVRLDTSHALGWASCPQDTSSDVVVIY